MKFTRLGIPGAFLVDLEPHGDERGEFARTWCAREFAAAGIADVPVQASLSWNPRRGTLRGLHWQSEPHGETKIVRCVRGTVYDVLVDVRSDSHTWRDHLAVELDSVRRQAVVIPPGVAHGFLTLTDDCELHYLISEFHVPDAARGARWNDPAFGIVWPETPSVVSERDRGWPDFLP